MLRNGNPYRHVQHVATMHVILTNSVCMNKSETYPCNVCTHNASTCFYVIHDCRKVRNKYVYVGGCYEQVFVGKCPHVIRKFDVQIPHRVVLVKTR